MPKEQLTWDYGLPYWRAILDHSQLGRSHEDAEEYLKKHWQSPAANPSWEDLFATEMAAIQVLPREDLARRLPKLREEFRVLYGDRIYADYIQACDANANEAELRADACYLQREIQRMRLGYNVLQKLQDRSRLVAAVLAAVAFIAVLIALEISTTLSTLFILIPVFTLGGTGGVISLLMRSHGLPSSEAKDLQVGILHLGIMPACRLSLQWLPAICAIEGIIGAGILYLMFQANLLSGTIFPAFPINPHFSDPGLAKLLVWSFLAGFSERLVPDLLENISSRGGIKMQPQKRIPDSADTHTAAGTKVLAEPRKTPQL